MSDKNRKTKYHIVGIVPNSKENRGKIDTHDD